MIASPNQPCSYGGVQHCYWSIAPDNGEPIKVIWMFFKEFRLEEHEHHSNCRCESNHTSSDCCFYILMRYSTVTLHFTDRMTGLGFRRKEISVMYQFVDTCKNSSLLSWTVMQTSVFIQGTSTGVVMDFMLGI